MQMGNATVTIGGGPALLTLPDVELVKVQNNAGNVIGAVKNSDDFGDEIGWNIGGSVSAPMTGANGRRKWLSVSGFWANIEDDDSSQCNVTATTECAILPLVDVDPAGFDTLTTLIGLPIVNETSFSISSSREVDHWGAALESRWELTPGVMGVTRAPNPRYFGLGADIRGIDQDLDLTVTSAPNAEFSPANPFIYTESLDTRYYGAYTAWGGDVEPFLFRGLWQRWGLQSSFALRGGVYYADTDYTGRVVDPTNVVAANATQLSLSSDDVAFIGGLALETRKKIGSRATLSLRSEYEYYSWVPDMRYNDTDLTGGGTDFTGPNQGTSISSDDAFSMRTMLRLTIGLGPRDLYEPSAYK